MRAKKPQTRLTGGSLAKSPKSKDSKSIKSNTATKQRPSESTVKCVSNNKLTIKNATVSAKAKNDSENNEKKSKSVNKTEVSPHEKASGSNSKEKAANRKKEKSEKKSTTSTVSNGEKKQSSIKDEKPVRPSKELKNLDIQLCGYSSVAEIATRESTGSDSDTDRIIKASICENVKTKARAASATFNSSGNRSPSVSSPGPTNSKQNMIPEKSTKTETTVKCTDSRSDEKSKKKKEPTKPKSPTKSKAPKATEEQEKSKKSNSENQKTEGDKNPTKSQKTKTKSMIEAIKITESPAVVVPTEKRIEIKTQIDESKSLIDTITEAINEVVKQYKDSNNAETTGPHSNITNSTETTKKSNKIGKTTKKKVLNEKKMDLIETATDLVNESKGAIKTVSKKTKAKPKVANDNKTDDKIGDQIKPNNDKTTEGKAAAVNLNALHSAVADITKKSNDKSNKSASKAKAKLKPDKKSTITEQTQVKGSKIIKIDLKAKKKVKTLATVKSASLKTAMKELQNKMAKESKVCQEDTKKNDEHKSQAKTDEMSDDDNLSLTELKAQLSKSDTKKSDSEEKSSKTNTKQDTAASSSTNKQKATKSSFKKPSGSNPTNSIAKKKLANQKEIGITTKSISKSDVYEFQDANFSGEDIPYVHKKKREKILSNTSAKQEKTDKINADVKNSGDKSKTLPLKKQNRNESHKTGAKQTKNDAKSTAKPAKSNSKTNNQNDSDSKSEKDESESDDKPNETKKTTTSHANKTHKLAAKNRRMKLFGFYSGPKRHRMASLNALAKVQCLYENESRTAQELGFVKEPQNVQRMKIVSEVDKTESIPVKSQTKDKDLKLENEKKEKKAKKDAEAASNEKDRDEDDGTVNNRTLRKVPGEGNFWEMENSSLDESSTEREGNETVSTDCNQIISL